MRTLVIDDRRLFDHARDADFSGEVVYARNSTDGVHAIMQQGPFDVVYLDHDLGWGDNGNDADIRPTVKLIAALAESEGVVGQWIRRASFYSCSSNYAGRHWTVDTLRDAGLVAHEKEPQCKLHRFS